MYRLIKRYESRKLYDTEESRYVSLDAIEGWVRHGQPETGLPDAEILAATDAFNASLHVVERVPLYEESGYKRQIAWIDATEFLFRKIEFYNQEDRLLKTLTLSNYRQYEGRFWRPHLLTMVNHQTSRSTKLDVNSLKFRTGLTETDFTEQAMERLR